MRVVIARHRRCGNLLRQGLVLAVLAGALGSVQAQGGGTAGSPPPLPPVTAPAVGWTDWSWWTSWWPWTGTSRPPTSLPPTGVSAPHYGDSLFYFYQGRYFTSVTNLMVSQHFGRMAPHDDEAEILRGGLFLSYGLHREAGEVFAQLIERGASQPVRDRAWYYLAKIRYQRGLLAGAEEALDRIVKPLPGALEEDRALLHANVLMARAKYVEAARVLEPLTKSPGATSYARYNLGVALLRSGDRARGTALLDEVGKQPATGEEFRSLRDRANVALGFAALQASQGEGAQSNPERARLNAIEARNLYAAAEQARGYLERVRLNGMSSNKALLGFGWAAAAQGRMNVALVPWTELAKRDATDAAVLEAKLAVPYAFAELGALTQAVDGYQEAIALFDRETTHLDESIAAIRAGTLIDGLIARNPGEEMGWFWNITDLPEGAALPHPGHLTQVLAQHEFQEAFKNYRDLRFLTRNLQQWQESLNVLRDMLANRRQAYAERLPQVLEKERALNLAEFEQRHDALTAEFERVEREVDVAALATARERELQVRLERVREELARAPDDAELATARDRYRRAAGALLWQQSEQYPERLWKARRAMQQMQGELAQAQQRNVALATAQRDEPQRLAALAARIEALSGRVDAMLPRVAELTRAQQAEVQELAVAELTRQKERLAAYGTQARFAVAQIYDRANVGKEAGRGSAQ
ncbi:MAG: tetratricopeptide repeat protein [Burkholderiaceae bacterium]|nr:tetratricopeptide repeat protein [Burkholderiaceae bacterium]